MLLKLIRNMCSEITILKLLPHPLGVNELTNFLSRSSPWWRHQMATFRVTGPLCAGNSPVTSEPPAQRPVTRIGALFSLNCAWMNSWENNREAGDLRRLRANYDVPVMLLFCFVIHWLLSRNHWALFDTTLTRIPGHQWHWSNEHRSFKFLPGHKPAMRTGFPVMGYHHTLSVCIGHWCCKTAYHNGTHLQLQSHVFVFARNLFPKFEILHRARQRWPPDGTTHHPALRFASRLISGKARIA